MAGSSNRRGPVAAAAKTSPNTTSANKFQSGGGGGGAGAGGGGGGDFVFLHHDPTGGGQTSSSARRQPRQSALTTAARAHASRRGHSKTAANAAAKRSFKFVTVNGDGSSFGNNNNNNNVGGGSDDKDSEYTHLRSVSRSLSPPTTTRTASTGKPSQSQGQQKQKKIQKQQQQEQQQQKQKKEFIIIDSTKAVVAAAGTATPPRSLRADAWDPFDSLAVHNLSHSEQFMLHYALTTTWAKFGESQSGQQELAQSWIWATIESPAALFAQIAAAASHYLTVPYADGATQRRAFTTSLQAKHKALKSLQYEIDKFHKQQEEQDQQWRQIKEQGDYDSPAQSSGVASPGSTAAWSASPGRSPSPFSGATSSMAQHHSNNYTYTQQTPRIVELPIRNQQHDQQQQYRSSPAPTNYSSPSSDASASPSPPPTNEPSSSYMSTSTAVHPASASAAAAAGATDSMLLAILVLAVHDNIDLTPVPEPHPLAPLATCRDMHIYGQMRFREEHMNALYGIVEQKGGLARMNQTVFGYVLPPADMLYNLCRGTPPRIPCHRRLRPMLHTDDWRPDPHAEFLLSLAGTGFRDVQCPHPPQSHGQQAPHRQDRFNSTVSTISSYSSLSSGGVYSPVSPLSTTSMFEWSSAATGPTPTTSIGNNAHEDMAAGCVLEDEMLAMLHVMAELTVALDHYLRGTPGAPKMLDWFVNNADMVAHRLMSKPSYLYENDNNDECQFPHHHAGESGGGSNSRPPSPAVYSHYQAFSESSHGASSSSMALGASGTPAFTGGQGGGMSPRKLRLPRYLVLRELSRHAALVYQDMVIFPTPARTGAKLRFARAMLPFIRALRPGASPGSRTNNPNNANLASGQVREEAEEEEIRRRNAEDVGDDESHVDIEVEITDHDQSHAGISIPDSLCPSSATDDFISWATVLGAIVTRFTPIHDEYVEQLAVDVEYQAHHATGFNMERDISAMMMAAAPGYYYAGDSNNNNSSSSRANVVRMPPSWPDYQARMRRFMWLDAVCDEPGLVVWEEAMAWRTGNNIRTQFAYWKGSGLMC